MLKNDFIMKFGGTSVGSAENIEKVIQIVSSRNEPEGIIVSAFDKVTDQLILIAKSAERERVKPKILLNELKKRHINIVKKLIKKPDSQRTVLQRIKKFLDEFENILIRVSVKGKLDLKTLDLIMSFGERLSAYIVAESFKANGITAEFIDARKLIKTDNCFSFAKVDFERTNKNIRSFFKNPKRKLSIVTGFIGSTNKNETTTLGRGGSDYTASIIGSALNVQSIEIWTDVNGIMSADPRKVPSAFTIPFMSYEEAILMSRFGAKVIFPPTMIPAMEKNIPIVIKNTFEPGKTGTIIQNSVSSAKAIKGIVSLLQNDISIVTIVGKGNKTEDDIVNYLFENDIRAVKSPHETSKINPSFAINKNEEIKTLNLLHESFFEKNNFIFENLYEEN